MKILKKAKLLLLLQSVREVLESDIKHPIIEVLREAFEEYKK